MGALTETAPDAEEWNKRRWLRRAAPCGRVPEGAVIPRSNRASRRTRLGSLVLCCALWPGTFGFGQNPESSGQPGEYDVKAAFLLNFTRFVDWPRAGERDFSICIVGEDPFADSLARMVAGESAGGRPLVVKHPHGEFNVCQILFVPASEPSQAAILAQAGPNVLTVGESPDFLRDGGMIRFLIEDRRVRFDINRTAVDRSALKMSSRLFGVARRVIK